MSQLGAIETRRVALLDGIGGADTGMDADRRTSVSAEKPVVE